MLNKQAKTLSDQQIKLALKALESCERNSLHNQAMLLLSLHGLRAKDIANLQINTITTSEEEISKFIVLQDEASKGKSGRAIPLTKLFSIW